MDFSFANNTQTNNNTESDIHVHTYSLQSYEVSDEPFAYTDKRRRNSQ